jgi:WD40 repeat protein
MEIKKIAQLTGHTGAVFAITEGEASSDSPFTVHHSPLILSGAGDGWVVEWDLSKPELGRLVAKVERNIFSLLFSENQNKIIAGDMDGGVRFVDLAEPSKIRNVAHHGGKGCFDIKIIDNQLFTIGGDGILTRWSLSENRSLESIQLSHKSLRCFAWSKTRNEFAIGSSDGSVYFVDTTTLELKNIWNAVHDNSIFSICYTPDEAHLLTGGRDAHLKLWDLREKMTQNTEGGISNENQEPKNLVSLPAHLFTINSIVFHPNNPMIFATASRDRTIKIWQLATTNPTVPISLLKVIDTIRHGCHVRSVNRLFWSPYNEYLISASDDRSLIVWKIEL